MTEQFVQMLPQNKTFVLFCFFRKKSKSHRDIKRMQCECPVLPREERSKGVLACGEDCLNRLLMIEW